MQMGEAAVKSGSVDPIWRELERDMEKRFAPPMRTVTSASRAELAVRQLVRPLPLVPEKSKVGWLARQDSRIRLEDEIRAIQDAYDEPAVGRQVEVDVELDGEGHVVAVRLVTPTKSPEFNQEALRAVTQALRQRSLADSEGKRGPVIARYALRAEVATNLPRISAAMNADGGSVHGAVLSLAGTFDEVTGKASVRVPFVKRLKTAVHLLSVRPKPAARP